VSARYCYSVWMRHMVKIQASGYAFPGTGARVAELGPGDSLGIGLVAMLSGCDEYFALDVKAHANVERNLAIFDELVRLVSERTPIPGDEELPLVFPKLADYSFPSRLLNERILERALDRSRIAAIVRAIKEQGRTIDGRIRIAYIAPWMDRNLLDPESVDIAFSQAVLEHVDDIVAVYRALHHWLRPGGLMSHTIDYQSHGITRDWNGHWTIGDTRWRLVRGTRPYLINRLPHSAHLRAIEGAGFRIVSDVVREGTPPSRAYLARRFLDLSDTDLKTSGSYIQALKPAAR